MLTQNIQSDFTAQVWESTFSLKFFYGLVFIFLCMVLVSCKVDDPKTDLVDISKTLADKSRDQSDGVGRAPKNIQLSDRQFTYLDIPEGLRDGPYYIDFDIFRDQGKIWSQSDIDCAGCDPQVKQERAQAWDLRVEKGRLSLNTNRLDDAGNTLQSMAATEYMEPIVGFNQSINLDNIEFSQQLAQPQSKIDPKNLFDNTTGSVGVNNAWLIRTSSGKRIVYFQFIDYDIQGKWLLFHVREQRLDQPQALFQPARKIYIKWSDEAQGQGKIQLSATGELFAYINFDGCFPDNGQSPCFTGVSSDLGSDVVSTKPMQGWDLYYETNIMAMTGGKTKLNGGDFRDSFNDGVDVAALHLGEVPARFANGGLNTSIKQLWGFSSFSQFEAQAVGSNRYKQTTLGTDGNNEFAHALYYNVAKRNGKFVREPNNRIYIFETTKGEGLGFQIAGIDEQGRISRFEYKGLLVKERRVFDIHFRQPSQTDIYDLRSINVEIPQNIRSIYFPIIALQDEIVDDDGNPLSDDEFKQLRFSVATLYSTGGHRVELRQEAISESSAKLLSKPSFPVVARGPSTYSVGTNKGIPSPIVLSISARQLGKEPIIWQTGLCFYSPGNRFGFRQKPCDKTDTSWKNQLKRQ